MVSQDKKKSIAMFYQRLNKVNGSWLRLKLKGLKEDAVYQVTLEGAQHKEYKAYGDELMYAGIPVDRRELDRRGGDFASLVYVLKEISQDLS